MVWYGRFKPTLFFTIFVLCTACSSNDDSPNDPFHPVLSTEAKEFFTEHWQSQYLFEAFKPGGIDVERAGEGGVYFPSHWPISSIDELDLLPLWVTREEDEFEHIKNALKWDQFIFGWDDPEGLRLDTELTQVIEQSWLIATSSLAKRLDDICGLRDLAIQIFRPGEVCLIGEIEEEIPLLERVVLKDGRDDLFFPGVGCAEA